MIISVTLEKTALWNKQILDLWKKKSNINFNKDLNGVSQTVTWIKDKKNLCTAKANLCLPHIVLIHVKPSETCSC